MSPSTNPFQATGYGHASYGHGYPQHPAAVHSPASSYGYAASDATSDASQWSRSSSYNSYATSPVAATSNALTVYSPKSLLGLWYSEHVHGPWATGLERNPFTPGLEPVSGVEKRSYVNTDPLAAAFPSSSKQPHDPLSWITEELFELRSKREAAAQQRTPLRASAQQA
ncbi:hypothetical protein HYH03_014137 [Edaphochlamys debaryana]|uniref:Uncharacterized protein n=1 Tax=Edaphochlamys debaryana TaxID=47281 RepID=A0A835XPQ8_9CHLO|nr:hypothetical protein HYH03_014137 [Edaphochlamys debaryana]|eukprot:KAG2487297.1 hypothetical protein HYH03_014137 [Edaphochlamys debaryana]